MVFAGLFPTDSDAYANLRDAMKKLQLNDRRFPSCRRTRPRWGSGFVAASWVCSTWRLSRNPGARVRPRSHHDGARRELPRDDHQGRAPGDRQPESPARAQLHRAGRGALDHRHDHHAGRVPGRALSCVKSAAARRSPWSIWPPTAWS